MIALWIGNPSKQVNQKHLLSCFFMIITTRYDKWKRQKKISRLTVSLWYWTYFLSALIGSSLGLLYNTLALCDLTRLPAFELKESIKTVNSHRNKSKEWSSCKRENYFWISMLPREVHHMWIWGVTQQLLWSKSHDFQAVFALTHSKTN
jgi:hypothetical protein